MTLASYSRPLDLLAPVPTTDLARYFAVRYTLDRLVASFSRPAPRWDAPSVEGVASVPPATGWDDAIVALERMLPYGCGVSLPSKAAVVVAACELDALRRQASAYVVALEGVVGCRPGQVASVRYGMALASCRLLVSLLAGALEALRGLA